MDYVESLLTEEQQTRLLAHCEKLRIWEPSKRRAIAVAMLTRFDVERAVCKRLKEEGTEDDS